MKKSILNIGKALNKAEQKSINGGGGKGPCPCTTNYTSLPGGGNFCSYPGSDPNFPGGVCLGTVVNGVCCVNH